MNSTIRDALRQMTELVPEPCAKTKAKLRKMFRLTPEDHAFLTDLDNSCVELDPKITPAQVQAIRQPD